MTATGTLLLRALKVLNKKYTTEKPTELGNIINLNLCTSFHFFLKYYDFRERLIFLALEPFRLATEPKMFFLFFCVTYSAFNFFDAWRQKGCWKIPKSPLSGLFGIERLFSKIKFPKDPPFNFLMFCNNGCLKIQKDPQFGRLGFAWAWYFGFFDTFMSFCYFWALDMAQTYAVPDLSKKHSLKEHSKCLFVLLSSCVDTSTGTSKM